MVLFKKKTILLFSMVLTVITFISQNNTNILAKGKLIKSEKLTSEDVVKCYMRKELSVYEKSLQDVERELEILEKQFNEGSINKQVYETRKKDLEKQISLLKNNTIKNKDIEFQENLNYEDELKNIKIDDNVDIIED
ncbi:MAG: hypothetical protein AB1782_09400 [Cyanobacteriota bacterium]